MKKLYRNFTLLALTFFISSCSLSGKTTSQSDNTLDDIQGIEEGIFSKGLVDKRGRSVKEILDEKPENWADKYYHKTYFKVTRPRVIESYSEIVNACKSDDFQFIVDYAPMSSPFKIKYKLIPINIKTDSGFSKQVYISKGACREISLFKSKKIKSAQQVRKAIKSMLLVYIYNQGTFLKEMVFETGFSDVEFLVE